jgi:ribosomal protein S18 acetylase RimI-like enzyme
MDKYLLTPTNTCTQEQIKIRLLEKSDLPAMEWEGEFIHFRNVYADLYDRIEKGVAQAWVAIGDNSHMVGQIFLQLRSDRLELADGWNRAYMYSFRVRPDYRNLGLGTRMLLILDDYLIQGNYTRLTLNVARDNADAIRLYHRCGFEIVAEEPGTWSFPDHNGIWQTVNEPSWRMEKVLPVSPKP